MHHWLFGQSNSLLVGSCWFFCNAALVFSLWLPLFAFVAVIVACSIRDQFLLRGISSNHQLDLWWEPLRCFVATGCAFLPSRHQKLQRRLWEHRRPWVWWAHWQRYWYQLLEWTLWLHFSAEWNKSFRTPDITICIMPFTPLNHQLPRNLMAFIDFALVWRWSVHRDGQLNSTSLLCNRCNQGKADPKKGKERVKFITDLFAKRFPQFPASLEDPVCDAWFVCLYCLPWHRRCPVCPWSKWSGWSTPFRKSVLHRKEPQYHLQFYLQVSKCDIVWYPQQHTVAEIVPHRKCLFDFWSFAD